MLWGWLFFNLAKNIEQSFESARIKIIEKEVNLVKPEIIYTHHISDLNIDHSITHRAVVTACRPEPKKSVKKIYCFEVPSSTDWQSVQSDKFF